MGDPAGVGPELCWRVLDTALLEQIFPVMVGASGVLMEAKQRFAPDLKAKLVEKSELTAALSQDDVDVLIVEASPLEMSQLVEGQGSAATGEASLKAIEVATDLCLDEVVHAMVTAPVSKYAIESSGVKFRGHTEWISMHCGDYDEMMMMSSLEKNLHVGYTSTHVPIKWLSDIITEDIVYRRILQCQALVKEMGLKNTKIGVCGLNPHAGENGLMGVEDAEQISPAIQRAREEGVDCDGPHPSDTLFVPRIRERYGIILAMYHDQGGIPFKMLAFDSGVNHTLGLPIVRTSVDHGTAWDLAWKGEADAGSFREAIKVALLRAKGRLEEMSSTPQ